MNFFEHTKGEMITRIIFLVALIVLALDILIWRP